VSEGLDVRDAGDGALLLRLPAVIDSEVNARVVAIATVVRQQRLRGVRDVVPTFHSVAVHFDPLLADVDEISDALRSAATIRPSVTLGRRHQIPVAYGGDDGPDLEQVAASVGITPEEVIQRHSALDYRVFMLGFRPGFAYLGLVDPILALPRRPTPRLRVPAGSVGIAGRQTAVYPDESPGGWQIVGRALEPVFDVAIDLPRLAPGDTVVFKPVAQTTGSDRTSAPGRPGVEPDFSTSSRRITITRPGLFTTVQDGGRWGRQADGFPVSGAMDRVSHAIANVVVGNEPHTAALEVTIAGPELRIEQTTTLAVAGADLSASLDGSAIELQTPVSVRPGGVLRFGPRQGGARAYVAFDGGIQASRRWPATPLAAGHVLILNPAVDHASSPAAIERSLPAGGARLRVLPGPQDDQLPATCLEALLRSRFTVSPQSNRIGYRLAGPTIPSAAGDMISDATFAGGIQVTPSGEPILLLADRQTTGGYPQVATVISADLPVAAQLAPGDWVEFSACTRKEAVAALAAQQSMVRDVR
jgi:KipI family sensor histidine kinase inhibitor